MRNLPTTRGIPSLKPGRRDLFCSLKNLPVLAVLLFLLPLRYIGIKCQVPGNTGTPQVPILIVFSVMQVEPGFLTP